MPTLLWRVLHDVGYLEDQEPVYSWSESQLAEDGPAVVEIMFLLLVMLQSGMAGETILIFLEGKIHRYDL
jgi:hypothetical protein